MKFTFSKIKTEKGFFNQLSGRKISTAIYVKNELGEVGCLPGENKAYLPLGGKKALLLVLTILEFKNVSI